MGTWKRREAGAWVPQFSSTDRPASSVTFDDSGLIVIDGTDVQAALEDVDAFLGTTLPATYAPLSVHFTKPVNGATRGSSTLGSLNTPWTDSVTVAAGEDVEYDITGSWQIGTQPAVYMALAVDGTIVDRVRSVAGGNDIETRMMIGGCVTGLSAGAHTFEVLFATSGGETIFISSVASTLTSVASNQDQVSSMRLRVCTAV